MTSRISLHLVTTGLLLLSHANAQTPVAQARADLAKAAEELQTTQREYADLRRGLYRDINRLDDEALALAKELRALDREEEQRKARAASLDREIEARKIDFNYSAGILNQYSKALVTRLHPAENQLYVEGIEAADQRAASASENPEAELAERMQILERGLERLGAVAGGHLFDGRALRNGSEAVEGKLLVVGPAVYFSQSGGGFEGVATFAETGTALPTVVALKRAGGIGDALAAGSGSLPFDGTMGKALEVAAAQESLLDVIRKGGVVGHAILTLGAISLLIALFKVYELSKFKVPSRSAINEILDDLLTGNDASAREKAAALPGAGGNLVLTGVERFHEKRRVLEEALFEKLVTIKPRLERFLPFLALTAAAAPLMGLLGTVLGIIKTFKAMALYGTGNAKAFSAGISEALITTAEGLVIAIPVLVLHGIMKSFVKAKFAEMEAVGIALINGTTEREKPEDSKASDELEEDTELSPNPA